MPAVARSTDGRRGRMAPTITPRGTRIPPHPPGRRWSHPRPPRGSEGRRVPFRSRRSLGRGRSERFAGPCPAPRRSPGPGPDLRPLRGERALARPDRPFGPILSRHGQIVSRTDRDLWAQDGTPASSTGTKPVVGGAEPGTAPGDRDRDSAMWSPGSLAGSASDCSPDDSKSRFSRDSLTHSSGPPLRHTSPGRRPLRPESLTSEGNPGDRYASRH